MRAPNASVAAASGSAITEASPPLPGEAEGDGGALPHFREQYDGAAMGLDELAGERQAEAERRIAALGGAVEAVRDPGLLGRRDAAAIVGDGNLGLAPVAGGAQQDATALVGMREGVLE